MGTSYINIKNLIYFQEVSENITPPAKKFTFGWSVYNLEQEFFRTMQDGVFAKADELGISIIPHNQNSDTVEMINGCINLVSQGINALIISPINPRAMGIVVELTKEAGIPVVVVDIGTGGADVDAFVISDNFGGGIIAGEYSLRIIKEHALASINTAIITVEDTAVYARLRGEGFRRVMTERGYKVVTQANGHSRREEAYVLMKEILASYINDLALVFCENDVMALGAAQAIFEAGKKGQILVVGFNGTPSEIEAIQEGYMQGTIAQQPFEMGSLGVDLANTILTGGTIIFDDVAAKELFVEVYLIDETGTALRQVE